MERTVFGARPFGFCGERHKERSHSSMAARTADGDIERDRKEAEGRGFRKITFIIDFERAQESMREITNLIDAGLVHVPPINVLALGDAALAHQMIETGHVRGKLVLKVAELCA